MTNTNDNADKNIAYGSKDGKIVHISSVGRGLECQCTCASCGANLIAKKGEQNAHHFAHHDGGGDRCGESVLHKLSKQIIADQSMVLIPEFSRSIEGTDIAGYSHSESLTNTAFTLLFEEVILEKMAATGNFIPDITATTRDADETIFIEIVVSNDVSDKKLEGVRALGVPMLSIDMSEYSVMEGLEEIQKAVLYDAPRIWVYHPDHDMAESELESKLQQTIERVNEGIKQAVMDTYSLLTIATPQTGIQPKQGEIIIYGYKSASGYSAKNRRDFDFSKLMIGGQINDNGSANYKIRSQGGYQEMTLDFDESLISQLEKMVFPCVAKLEVKNGFYGGRSRLLVESISK